MLKPKTEIVLEHAIEVGVRRGVRRSFKHTDNPSAEHIQHTVELAVWEELEQFFDLSGGVDG